MAGILVLTPLAVEHKALTASLLESGSAFDNLHLKIGGHGKVEFALATQILIQKFNPDLVICAGAAGALADFAKPLDVVVGENTVEHDFHLKFADRPIPTFAGDPTAIARLKQPHPHPFTVHFGTIASGDEDVLDPQRGREIALKTGALAVAWEGAGGARACRAHGVPFLELRVITDSANANAVQAFRENIDRGMVHLSRVIGSLASL